MTHGGWTNTAVYRFRVGAVRGALVGIGQADLPVWPGYAPNAAEAEVDAALHGAFLPAGRYTLQGAALYLEAGGRRVLVDTGAGAELGPGLGRLEENLRAAGILPESMDTVILTHAHPDHVGGVAREDGTLIFPNARHLIPAEELVFWAGATEPDLSALPVPDELWALFVRVARHHLGAARDAGRLDAFGLDEELAPGVRALPLPGHSPGHTGLVIESEGETLVHVADLVHHPAFDLAHPHWRTAFDHEPARAEATRRETLAWLARERLLTTAYHLPFPAFGHVRAAADGYAWEPAPWRFEP